MAGQTSSHTDYLRILNNESLTTGEISSLVQLRSPCHVTIIACSGGRLRVDQGDEVMGLIPAFMMKGATSAVGTLWRTRDDVGAEFTRQFYKFFQKQDGNGLVDLAKAFQSAIVSMDPAAVQPPYFWAGFVLYGCWMYESPEVTQDSNHPFLWQR
jgi:CHAT domain-containing protein